MAKRQAHPLLQVLFEPWPDRDGTIRWDAQEAFAGNYWIDALDEDGAFIPRGFRAQVTGCTTCYRHADDARVHWPDLNTLPNRKVMKKCPKWKRVEAIVKAFGGWERTHYVELPVWEGLEYQPIPQRRRIIEACPVCEGAGYGAYDTERMVMTDCPAGCGAYTYGGRGEIQVSYEGPLRPDRFALADYQRRMRSSELV